MRRWMIGLRRARCNRLRPCGHEGSRGDISGKTYGVGIMGAGNISAAYLRLAPLFKNLEVRAIADIVPAAAQKRAEEYSVAAQTPDELLKNSEIDVIVNLTIPSTHFDVSHGHPLGRQARLFGKAVRALASKRATSSRRWPTSTSSRSARRRTPSLGGAHQQARSIIDSGKLGKIASGTTHVLEPRHGALASQPGLLLPARRRPDPRSRPLSSPT